ncbi:MAG: type ISP restriction/modification enzyme [Candidatus Parcubacteria bacterium]|nr:type ISP restriction/modification enzyme [Candidatus Parcubacteria bacterium]
MSQIVNNFIQKVSEQNKTGHAREHAYRPALQELFKEITGLKIVNEPKWSEYGAPDFVFINKNIVTAYAEAKDLPVSLQDVEKGEQMARYYGYSNLILTNCLEFRFYKNGQQCVPAVVIAKLKNENIEVDESNYQLLEDTIKDFIKDSKEPIKSGVHLAKVMAGKARRIRDNIKVYLKNKDNKENNALLAVYNVIKKLLLADLDYDKFADLYAQTVVYGLFAARYHDETPENFTRQEARDLVPASNPFLREFFDHIAGASFDKRIEFIVNELCEEFTHADVQAIVHNYYNVEKDSSRDPIIHFYEDFLQEYDSSERKKMGVFYTPLPVVRFIVRSIDDILKKDFGLKGLIDSSKIEITGLVQGKKVKRQIHKVQILDPATGTGTFLNESILYLKNQFIGQEGRWPAYIQEDLLPRLHGFELMMASYTIAHLKLSTTIKESGADIKDSRLNVFLTNSLKKGEKYDDTLFAGLGLDKALTEESRLANQVKNDLPIMVVLGNPPYNVSSQNKGEWIGGLIKDYKEGLGERKINLDDDYIKFIRFAEYLIEKNGEGIIGMITNNSYIDGITHRQMRKKLLETFDDIYIVDLHGSSKKKETAPDGSKDENVFNIQQGVAIVIFVRKSEKKKGLGKVWHTELYGKRADKFTVLDNSDIKKIKWQKIDYKEPYYFFVPKDFGASEKYEKGFKIDKLFVENVTNIVTSRDSIVIDFDKGVLLNRLKALIEQGRNFIPELKNTRDWNVDTAIEELKSDNNISEKVQKILYRPFDTRYIFYAEYFLDWPRMELMPQMLKSNIGLVSTRQVTGNDFNHILVTKWITEYKLGSHDRNSYTFPLYLYARDGSKMSNLKKEIVAEIEKITGKIEPENILDYIYAVLYSPIYREKYKEFLKIDFPRVPYPGDKDKFKKLVALGRELREFHLLESPKMNNFITTFPEAGSDTIEKKFLKYKNEKVYINGSQYFGGVPESAWNFFIGGYQPAQKWLKDRQGRKLTNADIEHYQKMIVALTETGRIMEEIDGLV